HAHRTVFAEGKRLAHAISHQRDARLRFYDPPGVKLYALDVARRSRRLQTAALELAGDIFGGPAMALAAGFAPFQFVVGEIQHMRPPAFGLRGVRRAAQRKRYAGDGYRPHSNATALAPTEDHFFPFTFLYSARMVCNWRAWFSAWPA